MNFFIDNPLNNLYLDEIIYLVSSIPPIELGILSELLFFIREREEEYFVQTFIQLLQYNEALELWQVLDFMWLTVEDKEWVYPLMKTFLQKKLYYEEEFDI